MRIEEEIKQSKFRNESQKAIINLFFTSNWIENHLRQLLKPHNITIQQYNVLRIMNGQYPKKLGIQDISSRMIDKMPDVSRIVERLRKQGLLLRKASKEDKRLVKLSITAKGRELIASLNELNPEIDGILQNLTEEEKQSLNQLLDKIRG